MTETHQHQHDSTAPLPETLDSSGAKLVYLYLRLEGHATIDDLHRALNMRKGALYSLLRTLTATDLVERTGTTYHCHQTGETS